ncbi:FkbM family methyltransferase [Marinimicrobium locisalis]|uniref:FkbM family methyltransferase n=1 Tax=Marinimicrobium locisalis TaxID=546022 RepID=UPI00322209CD
MKLDKPLNLNFDVEQEEESRSSTTENRDQESTEGLPSLESRTAFESKIKELQNSIVRKDKELEELAHANAKLKKELDETTSKGGDADIDEFLRDLEPFYYNRSLTYVDVGAFVGDVFDKIHKSSRLKVREAHLFEPNPESFSLLKKKIEPISNMPSLHAYNMALGEKEEVKTFLSAKSMTKVANVDEQDLDSKTAFKCKVSSLDIQSEKVTDRKISLLKVDVEGYELDVLKGASSLLERQSIDIIYMEVGLNQRGTQQTYFADLDRFLQQYKYRVFKIYEQKNEWIDDSPLLRRCNIAYMSESFSSTNSFQAAQEIKNLKMELASLKEQRDE